MNVLILNNEDLLNIHGGIKISGTLINAVSSVIRNILEVGRGLGSAVRRLSENKPCPL